MSFRDDVLRFVAGTYRPRSARLHGRVVELANESIVEGSVITGAPGQPVAPDAPPGVPTLKASWQTIPQGQLQTVIATDRSYAPDIEDGVRNGRALVLRSRVGGFHSVKMTIAGWGRIVAQALREVTHGE